MRYKIFLALCCFIFFILNSGCIKEESTVGNYVAKDNVEGYTLLISNLHPHCPDSISSQSFTMLLNNHEVCYYGGVEGKLPTLGRSVQFTTEGPSVSSNSQISNYTNAFMMGILNPKIPAFEDEVRIHTPKYDPGRDPIKYLDSLFSIKKHQIFGINGNDLLDFEVELFAGKPLKDGLGLASYQISTSNGPQAESSLVINEVRKVVEDGILYYDLDISLNCVLYHWPQTGRTGVFARLENGRLVSRFKPEFY